MSFMRSSLGLLLLLFVGSFALAQEPEPVTTLVPRDWDPAQAGNQDLIRILIRI